MSTSSPVRSRRTAAGRLSLAVAVALSVPGAALAQQALEEVVVTARKRSESLQDVPISVSAFTESQIEQAGIERPADFIGLIPNVTIVDTANVGDTQVSIRGIVSTRDAESTFAYVVDGVLITNPNAFNEELFDVQQIEVLKGPQGALYGRNAVAGAILVTTKAPGDELEARVTAGVGNVGTRRINAVASGPISDNVRGRIGASYRTTDGFYENVFQGGDDAVDYLEDTSFKGRLDWDVNDNLSLDFRAGVSQVDGGAINFNAVFAIPAFASVFGSPAFDANVNEQDFIFAFNVPGENEQDTTEFSIKADYQLERATLTAVFAYNDLEEYLLSDGTSASFYGYEVTPSCLNDRLTLNNAPGALGGADRTDLFGPFFQPFGVFAPTDVNDPFNDPSNFAGVYGPYTPTSCDGYQYQERNQSDTSLEVRLTSDDSYAARWIAGLYFADIERDVVVAYGADTGQGFLRQPYVAPTGPNPTDLLFDDTFDTTVISAFGQVEFDLSDTVELAIAARFDQEDRDVSNNVPNVNASGLNINAPGPINPAFGVTPSGIPDRSETFEQFQPKVSLNWAATDNLSVFGTYGVGFRSGGFNSIGSQATIDFWLNDNGDGTNPGSFVDAQLLVRDEYDKEVTTSFEVGAKGVFLDRRLRVNAALFRNEVEDNQFFEFFAGPWGLLRVVTTIDEVEISGFEADFDALVTDNLSFFGGIGILDSEITENQNRPLSVGNNAPQAPELTYNLGANLNIAVAGDLEFNARIDYQFVDEMWFHTLQGEETPTVWQSFPNFQDPAVFPNGVPQNLSQARRDDYGLLNVRFSLSGERWTATLYGRNVTDEEYLQEVIPAPEFGGSFVHPSARDAYGAEFTFRF
ncbi:MAG: TonB-dependent receptor [Pseudomonadota bacterium]